MMTPMNPDTPVTTTTIKPDERAELDRILDGGAFDAAFWNSRWHAAKAALPPSVEEEIRVALYAADNSTVQGRRQRRKLEAKLVKLAGAARARTYGGYTQGWGDEQKRLSNLEHAAIYISRANLNIHFCA
jgi:hypothetical protein